MSSLGQRARSSALDVALCWVVATGAPTAAAAERSTADEARAGAAYEAALVAIRAHDYARAASLFDEADTLVPNVVALRSAIDAAVLAQDAVLAVRLSERAAKRPANRALEASARKALDKFEQRVGRVRVECAGHPCTAMMDGSPAPVGESLVVAVGSHSVVIDDGVKVTRRQVEVAAGTVTVAAPSAPEALAEPSSPAADDEEQGGWSPAVFWVGLGTTAVLGGFTIWSAVDTRDRYAAYLETGEGADDGRGAQLRTNIMLVTTLSLGLATAAVGVFAVGWSDGDGSAVTATVGPGGATVAGRFP